MNRNATDPAGAGESDDVLSHRMREAAQTVEANGQLPSASGVRARGLQRRRRRTTGLVAAAALAVVGVVTGTSVVLGNSGAQLSPATDPPAVGVTTPLGTTVLTTESSAPMPSKDRPITPPQSAQPGDPETSAPVAGSNLLDGGRSFDLFTPDGQWVTPTVEGGGLAVVDQPEAGGVATSWLIRPVGDGLAWLQTVDRIDGRTRCLNVGPEAAVGLEFCDSTSSSMVLNITLTTFDPAAAAPTITVASAGSHLTVVNGRLTTTTDPAQATAFTAVDRGQLVAPTS